MITFIAFVVIVLYVVSMKQRLQASLDRLADRIRVLEGQRPATPAPAQPLMRQPAPAPSQARPTMPTVIRPALSGVEGPADVSVETPSIVEPRDDAASSLEAQIGSRWLLYAGVVAILIGAAYFHMLAIENQWIGERARVIEGTIAGLALVFGGRRFIAAGYGQYGQILSGCGVAVLYVTVFAASTLYHLVNRPLAFVIMCAITALAAWLANRHRSQGLAVMAVGGGFVTPFLLPSGTDAQIALFTYDAVLIAGTMYLAHRRVWPWLNLLSYGLTVLTVGGWAEAFYTPSKYLVTELYLTLYCGMFLYILHETWRASERGNRPVVAALWSAPCLYYLASLAILHPHPMAMLIYLLLLCVVGAGVGARTGAISRMVFRAAVVVPLMYWIAMYGGPDWLAGGAAAVIGVHLVHLLSYFEATRGGNAPAPADTALVHVNGLATYAALHLLLVASLRPEAPAAVAAIFALWHGIFAYVLSTRRRDESLHFAAVAFTLTAVAVALYFDGAARTIGWGVEGAAVMWLGLRERRDWLRAGGAVAFAVAVIQLIFLQIVRPLPSYTSYAIVLNPTFACGVCLIALAYTIALLHDHRAQAERAVFLLMANVLTLTLLTSEITAYWQVEGFNRFGREVALSTTWALYAIAMIMVGIRRRYAPIRYLAIAVLGGTILKVFVVDLAALDQIYRVSSAIGLGVLLLVTSYLYHRFRARLAPVE